MLSRVFLMAISILVILALYLLPSEKLGNNFVAEIPVFANQGEEITLTLHNSSFGSLTSGGGNQVSVFAQYTLNDNSIAGQTINAVMQVYAPNGTLIRTSSFPNGFVAQASGGIEGLETTIRDRTLQSVTANVTFRDISKSEILSNDLLVDLILAQEGGTPATPGESTGIGEEGLFGPSPSQQSGQGIGEDTVGEGGDSDEDESQQADDLPSVPLG
jgi:hypothetical protein